MNILIFDNDQLCLCILGHSIAHFQVQPARVQIKFVSGYVLCRSTDFYVVGNSARRLIHAIVNGHDRVHLAKSESLTNSEFQQYQEAEPQGLAGLLPDAAVPLISA